MTGMGARASLLVLVIASLAASARAGDEEDARRLFDEGHAAADRGDHGEACRKFDESLALSRRSATLLNLGACHEKLGQLVTALAFWRQGLAELGADDKRRVPAEERIAALEQRVPRLRLRLPRELPADAAVQLDGKALSPEELREEIAIDPGQHDVAILAPGRAPARIVALLGEGSRETVTLEVGAPLAPPPLPKAPPSPPPSRPMAQPDAPQHSIPIWVWPVGGVGLAVGLAAIPFAVDYRNTLSRQEELCAGDLEACRPTPPGSYDPADDNARRRRDVIAGVVLASAGGAAVLAAVIGAALGTTRADVSFGIDGLRARF